MKHHFALVAFALLFVGCDSKSPGSKKGNDSERGNTNPSIPPQKSQEVIAPSPSLSVVTQVNSKAFNAYNIWRDGQQAEMLDYPQGWEQSSGVDTSPEDVFTVAMIKYWSNDPNYPRPIMGIPTEGASVVDDVLEYPVRDGKQLKLKFEAKAIESMTHYKAAQYCKDLGLRLPTVRELFDYCAAGVKEPNYGPNFQLNYPSTARCWTPVVTMYWSASVVSDDREYAWVFEARKGYVNTWDRASTYGRVRCVGSL